MISYVVSYSDIKIGYLDINETGQHRYTPIEERMEYIKASCSLFPELWEKSEWREPIPLLKNRIEDARRFHCEKDIQNQTDDFRLRMISPDVSAKKRKAAIMIVGYILESDSGGVQIGPVEQFSGVAGKFIDYHTDENGETDGVIFEIDYGHGYGFNHGTELKTFHPGDSFSFTIEYTDTSDGIWENELISFSLKIFESDHELVFTITSRGILEKEEKLLRDAAFYRERTFTSVKMTTYYGREYTDALERADKGEPCAFCLLGQMFENSVYHAMEKRDYEDPPLGYRAAAKIYYELAALSGYAKGAYYLGEIYRRERDYEQAEKWLLEAAERDITDSYHALGNLYEELWKQEHLEKYLQKALVWKQNALEAGCEKKKGSAKYDLHGTDESSNEAGI